MLTNIQFDVINDIHGVHLARVLCYSQIVGEKKSRHVASNGRTWRCRAHGRDDMIEQRSRVSTERTEQCDVQVGVEANADELRRSQCGAAQNDTEMHAERG